MISDSFKQRGQSLFRQALERGLTQPDPGPYKRASADLKLTVDQFERATKLDLGVPLAPPLAHGWETRDQDGAAGSVVWKEGADTRTTETHLRYTGTPESGQFFKESVTSFQDNDLMFFIQDHARFSPEKVVCTSLYLGGQHGAVSISEFNRGNPTLSRHQTLWFD